MVALGGVFITWARSSARVARSKQLRQKLWVGGILPPNDGRWVLSDVTSVLSQLGHVRTHVSQIKAGFSERLGIRCRSCVKTVQRVHSPGCRVTSTQDWQSQVLHFGETCCNGKGRSVSDVLHHLQWRMHLRQHARPSFMMCSPSCLTPHS